MRGIIIGGTGGESLDDTNGRAIERERERETERENFTQFKHRFNMLCDNFVAIFRNPFLQDPFVFSRSLHTLLL